MHYRETNLPLLLQHMSETYCWPHICIVLYSSRSRVSVTASRCHGRCVRPATTCCRCWAALLPVVKWIRATPGGTTGFPQVRQWAWKSRVACSSQRRCRSLEPLQVSKKALRYCLKNWMIFYRSLTYVSNIPLTYYVAEKFKLKMWTKLTNTISECISVIFIGCVYWMKLVCFLHLLKVPRSLWFGICRS